MDYFWCQFLFLILHSYTGKRAGYIQPHPYFTNDGSKCRIMETNVFEDETQVNKLIWYLERDRQLAPEEYCYNMRMIYPHSMDILLSDAGLIIKEKLGDYDGSPIDEESEMQIYVCSKN